MLPPSTLP
uniref:Uncharacterized protein n=1 Tax=Arundo donax TaxID=35708 RepID=A0A0A9ARF0_ARUDO